MGVTERDGERWRGTKQTLETTVRGLDASLLGETVNVYGTCVRGDERRTGTNNGVTSMAWRGRNERGKKQQSVERRVKTKIKPGQN